MWSKLENELGRKNQSRELVGLNDMVGLDV